MTLIRKPNEIEVNPRIKALIYGQPGQGKTTEHFQQTIKAYLDSRAQEDELFAVSYAKEDKNIDNCCTYILNAVQKSGCSGFADEEIYSLAAHYYDEDNIDVGKPVKCGVVVNHVVELTEQDIEEARQKAMNQVINEQLTKLKAKPVQQKKDKKPIVELPSLF